MIALLGQDLTSFNDWATRYNKSYPKGKNITQEFMNWHENVKYINESQWIRIQLSTTRIMEQIYPSIHFHKSSDV